jgi:hypothetical protein
LPRCRLKGGTASFYPRPSRVAGADGGHHDQGAAKEDAMREHKFRVGQTVDYSPPRSYTLSPPRSSPDRLKTKDPVLGRFSIVRLMPALGSEQQYRIKSTVDGHERMALESQLGFRSL